MDNFNLKKFILENKLARGSRLIEIKQSELKQIIREEVLKELFDTKEKIRWREGEDTDFTATFTGPNDQKYTIDITSLEFLIIIKY